MCGFFLVEFLWWYFFPPHTKFHQIVKYLRLGGIFSGKIPPTISTEAKNAGGMYPISTSPFGEFWNLGGNFLHIVNFEFLLLFVCSIWNGWGKEGTRWADTVGPAANYAIAKNFLNFESLGSIEYDLPLLFSTIWKSMKLKIRWLYSSCFAVSISRIKSTGPIKFIWCLL